MTVLNMSCKSLQNYRPSALWYCWLDDTGRASGL